jgi:hypothetical protein
MKAVLKGLLISAVGMAMPLSTTPASAQMSPAQLKAQKDRAAREAAARAEAARRRAAAAANVRAQAAAVAREAALKAEATRLTRARKNAALLVSRQQAARDGKINSGWAIGVWAPDSLLSCYSGAPLNFSNNGEWSSEGSSGTWTVANGTLVFRTTEQWDVGEETPAEKGDFGESSLIPIKFTEEYFIVENGGGHDVWFRCQEGDELRAAVSQQEAQLVTQRARKRKFADDNHDGNLEPGYYDRDFGEYDKGWKLWEQNSFSQSKDVFEGYMRTYPDGYRRSYVRNFLGIYYRYHEVDLPKAAGWFLQNYQLDPGGERAADSLLSLAEVMKQLGDEPRYCLVLKKFLNDYTFEAQYRLEPRFTKTSKLATCQ